jgi:cytochrome c-type biogenesis protein CcmH/NrfF
MQLGQRFIKRGGAGRKHIASALNGLPIVVIIIIAVVWFAKQREAREEQQQR